MRCATSSAVPADRSSKSHGCYGQHKADLSISASMESEGCSAYAVSSDHDCRQRPKNEQENARAAVDTWRCRRTGHARLRRLLILTQDHPRARLGVAQHHVRHVLIAAPWMHWELRCDRILQLFLNRNTACGMCHQ